MESGPPVNSTFTLFHPLTFTFRGSNPSRISVFPFNFEDLLTFPGILPAALFRTRSPLDCMLVKVPNDGFVGVKLHDARCAATNHWVRVRVSEVTPLDARKNFTLNSRCDAYPLTATALPYSQRRRWTFYETITLRESNPGCR